jgi:hypothetical protein
LRECHGPNCQNQTKEAESHLCTALQRALRKDTVSGGNGPGTETNGVRSIRTFRPLTAIVDYPSGEDGIRNTPKILDKNADSSSDDADSDAPRLIIDPDLQAVVEAWPGLSEGTRDAIVILAMGRKSVH